MKLRGKPEEGRSWWGRWAGTRPPFHLLHQKIMKGEEKRRRWAKLLLWNTYTYTGAKFTFIWTGECVGGTTKGKGSQLWVFTCYWISSMVHDIHQRLCWLSSSGKIGMIHDRNWRYSPLNIIRRRDRRQPWDQAWKCSHWSCSCDLDQMSKRIRCIEEEPRELIHRGIKNLCRPTQRILK